MPRLLIIVLIVALLAVIASMGEPGIVETIGGEK